MVGAFREVLGFLVELVVAMLLISTVSKPSSEDVLKLSRPCGEDFVTWKVAVVWHCL